MAKPPSDSHAAGLCTEDQIITAGIRDVYYGRDPQDAAHPSLQYITQPQRNYLACSGVVLSSAEERPTTSSAYQQTHMPAAIMSLRDETELIRKAATSNQETTGAVENQEMAAPNLGEEEIRVGETAGAVENQDMAAPNLGEEEIRVDDETESPLLQMFENIYQEIGAAANQETTGAAENQETTGAAENQETEAAEHEETGAAENEETGVAENEEIEAEENPEIAAVENPETEAEIRLGDETEFPNLKRFDKITKKERRGEFQR